MEILIKASQLILSLSILVVLHELGHFIPAKLFKTRVEKFYLFFDPWFSLFKVNKGGTEYGIGWLPLGGYVKIAGMIDESMDKEQMKQPPQSWEFRSKPAWQRLIIMIGGVTVNAILGIIIYAGILFYWGEEYLPTESLKYGVAADSLAMEMGIQSGDKILSVDGKTVENFLKVPGEMILTEARTVQVERNGQKIDLNVPSGFYQKLIKQKANFLSPRFPFFAESFAKESVGEKAGIKKGDQIVGLNDINTGYFDDFFAEIKKHKKEKVNVKVIRNGRTLEIAVQLGEESVLGIYPKSDMSAFFEVKKQEYSFISAIPAGFKKGYDTFSNYLKQLKLLFSPEVQGYKHLGGFITLGSAFSPDWDWHQFWNFTAFLSIVLAIMNLLPIPALDGGHVIFTLYEMITKRKPNEKFLEYAQIVGMVLLLSLLLFANGNDVLRLFTK